MNHKVVFIYGVKRTGTNLLRAILGSHSIIHSINKDANNIDKVKPMISDNHITCIKSHCTLEYLDDINRVYPDNKIICIVRDPRAVWCSRKYWDKRDIYDIQQVSKQWNKGLQEWSNIKDKYMTIKYEDLVSNPISITKEVCKYIGIEFESGMLNYDVNWGRKFKGGKYNTNRTNSSFKHELSDKLIYTKTVDIWKTKLDRDEIEYIQDTCKDIMEEYEYRAI